MRGIASAVLTLAVASSAAAQGSEALAQRQQQRRASSPAPRTAATERMQILLDGGVQIASGAFGQDFTLTKNVEATPITTDLSLAPAGFFDIGARLRVTRALSVGVVGFVASSKADGTVDARIPHPFYFNQLRPISGDLSGLTHLERGAHIELAYPVVASDGHAVTIFGGPSYISTRQDLVTDVTYSETYPYDTATFSSATTTQVTKGALGANVGADVTWRLSRSLRAGALVRYTFANVSLEAASGNTVDLHAGGLQVGAGVRVLIR